MGKKKPHRAFDGVKFFLIMSDEELDMVAGGTKQELQELYSAMASDRIICKLKIVLEAKKSPSAHSRRVFSLTARKIIAKIALEAIKMTETINITVDSEDLKEFKEKTGMTLLDCMKILMNSIKYGGKLELDPFWSDENISELKRRIKNGKMERHELIEVD